MAFEGLSEKLNAVFKNLRGKGRLTEADVRTGMREVRLALLEADVSYKVVKDFVAQVTERCVGSDVLESLTPAQQIIKIVNEELTKLMGSTNAKITTANHGPTVVMMVGLQGAGKTTNGAKLAGLMRRQFGKRPLLAACDVYRPAAITQLQVVGKQLDIPVFEMGQIAPVTIAKEAVKYAAFELSDTQCIVAALAVNASAFISEIIRAGIAAVDKGQWEAARSIGLSESHMMTHVILPQAVKNILPALCNEFISTVKGTSLASVFFVGELMTSFKTVQSATFLALQSLTIVGIIYFVLNFVLSRLLGVLERRLTVSD